MKTAWLSFLLLTLSNSALANLPERPPSQSGKQYCKEIQDPNYFIRLGWDPQNRIAFRNPGGPLDTGTCWWHARLQRSALYLTVFRPELAKPTRSEALSIIDALARNRGVVEVPGYRNIRSFSDDWRDEIKKYLGEWEIKDLFLRMIWINAIRPSRLSADAMSRTMDKLYERVEKENQIAFIIVKFDGFINRNHANLVIGMNPVANGYDIQTIDSNYPGEVISVPYRHGMTDIQIRLGPGAPYIQQNGDLGKYSERQKRYCEQVKQAPETDLP